MKIDLSPDQLYQERLKRIEDAIHLRIPDRVPILTTATFFPTSYGGLSPEEAMYDYDGMAAAWKKYLLDFQPDMFNNPFNTVPLGRLMESLDYKVVRWPGHGVPRDSTFQFVEGEYMKAEEYEAFLSDPSDFVLRTYLPRICGALEPLKMLPRLGDLHYFRALTGAAPFAIPQVASALRVLINTGAEARRMQSKEAVFSRETREMGFPIAFSATINAPFDYIGNSFRGTRGIMLDMYRTPDRLLAAITKVTPMIIKSAISTARRLGNPRIFIPLHKGADGFMSLEQFKTFYWPSLKKVFLALIDGGLTPCPFFEGQYASRLEIIGDIPAGKALYKFERTDMFLAKKVLGKRVCIRGNVPASMLCTASVQEVRDYCKKLIDEAARDGGFVLDGATGIPDEASPANVKAMFEFTREYGVYR